MEGAEGGVDGRGPVKGAGVRGAVGGESDGERVVLFADWEGGWVFTPFFFGVWFFFSCVLVGWFCFSEGFWGVGEGEDGMGWMVTWLVDFQC